MILHIIKKDLRLLWKVVVLVAAVQATLTLMLFHIDHAATSKNPYGLLLQLILFIALLGRSVLIVMCVQEDAIPGEHQDWLTRPVSRVDLLLAKVVFVMLFAQGPVFLADFIQAVASGASIEVSFTTALTRTVFLTIIMALPFMAFGALTKNLTQAIAGAVVFFLVLAGGQMLFVGLNEGRKILEVSPTTLTGFDWMTDAIRLVLASVVITAVLAMQYFRRRTKLSQIVLACGVLLCFAARLLPWNVAYALQQRLSTNSAEQNLAIRFEPLSKPRESRSGVPKDLLQGQFGGTVNETVVYLPISVDGMPSNSLLKTDRVSFRMKTPDGKTFDLGVGGDFQPLPRTNDLSQTYSPMYLPDEVYQRYKNSPVDLEASYSLTSLQLSEDGDLSALNGERAYATIGLCRSRMNSGESEISVRCLHPGIVPLCTSTVLRSAVSPAANPPVISCQPNYAPVYPMMIPDGISRFSAALPFRDPNGVGHYQVEGKEIPEAHVDIKIYEAAAHVRRTLTMQNIRLDEWVSR